MVISPMRTEECARGLPTQTTSRRLPLYGWQVSGASTTPPRAPGNAWGSTGVSPQKIQLTQLSGRIAVCTQMIINRSGADTSVLEQTGSTGLATSPNFLYSYALDCLSRVRILK